MADTQGELLDPVETDRLLAALEALNEREHLAAIRDTEYRVELATARTPFEAYWAGSASASALRDRRAGRAVTNLARTPR